MQLFAKKLPKYNPPKTMNPHLLWELMCMILFVLLTAALVVFAIFFLHISRAVNTPNPSGADPAIEKLSTLHKKIQTIKKGVEERTGENIGE